MKTTGLVLIAALAIAVIGVEAVAQQGPDSQSGAGMTMPMGPGKMGGMGMGKDMGMGMGMGMMKGCPMMGMMGMMGGGMAPHTEGRIAFLQAELGITDAQRSQWNAYADALRKNLDNMQSHHQAMMKSREAKSPVERLDGEIAAMEGRLGALKDLKAPLAALVATLSPEQSAKANDILTGMGCMM